MRLIELFAMCVLGYMIYAFTIQYKPIERDGLIYYLIETNGNDTTYTLFSVYGMRGSIEMEVGQELVDIYQNNNLKDTLIIETSKCKVIGKCCVDTLSKPYLIDFYASKYFWNNGRTEVVEIKNIRE